jgi:hypothetical protein
LGSIEGTWRRSVRIKYATHTLSPQGTAVWGAVGSVLWGDGTGSF